MTRIGSTIPLPIPTRRLLPAALLIASLVYVLLVISPTRFNPDASAYFGMALRFSQGEWWGGVHLMHSPLLPLLMVPFVFTGVLIPTAFGIVTALFAGGIFYLSFRLSNTVGLSKKSSWLIALVTLVQTLPFALTLITPDFLTVLLTVGMLILLCSHDGRGVIPSIIAGSLAGLSYLAKSSELPIWIVFLSLRFACRAAGSNDRLREMRELLLMVGSAMVISLPWMVAISVKAGAPLISGQQLALSGQYDLLNYHPDLPLDSVAGHVDMSAAGTAAGILMKNASNRSETAGSILGQFLAASFSFPVLLVLLAGSLIGVTTIRGDRFAICMTLFGYGIVRISLYLLFGGPYARFYLPLLCIINIAFFLGVEKVFRRSSWKSANVILAILASLLLIQPVATVYELSREPEDPALRNALTFPEIASDRSALAGNLDRPITGYVAYRLGRESWGYVSQQEMASGSALPKLRRWKISQLLWLGVPPESLLNNAGVSLVRHVGEGESSAALFKVLPGETP